LIQIGFGISPLSRQRLTVFLCTLNSVAMSLMV